MDNFFKDEQAGIISKTLNIPKVHVYTVITEYVSYLKRRLDQGETIKFLNICYLRYDGKDESFHETMAYISGELSKLCNLSSDLIFRVLDCFESLIIKELQKLNSFCIRGIVRIHLEKYNGEYKVRINKSTVYNSKNVYVSTLPSFKRRVGVSG